MDEKQMLDLYLCEARRYPMLTSQQERELALKAKAGDQSARWSLVQANLRLVVYFAQKKINFGVPFLDLIQEGNLGLMRAVDKFDPTRGVRFSSYAGWWIKQAIHMAIANKGNPRQPYHLYQKCYDYQRAKRALTQALGRAPREHEIAARLGWSPKKLRQYILPNTRSLEEIVDADESYTLADVIPDQRANTAEQYERAEMRAEVRQAVSKLSSRHQNFIRLRYGIGNENEPLSSVKIAARLEITHQAVDQHLKAGLEHLRHAQELA